MLHGVFKKHKIHDGIELIVRLQGFLQDLVEGLPGGDCVVARLSDSLGKVAVDQWLQPHSITIQLLRRRKRSRKCFQLSTWYGAQVLMYHLCRSTQWILGASGSSNGQLHVHDYSCRDECLKVL